jgi:hypothetical protein
MIDDADLSANRRAIPESEPTKTDDRWMAPCPEDRTEGVTIAIAPTASPPSAGRRMGRILIRSSTDSQVATPRISTIPTPAAAIPTKAAMARS